MTKPPIRCSSCKKTVPPGRRSYCSSTCSEREKKRRATARKRSAETGTPAALSDDSAPEASRTRVAPDYSKRSNQYAADLAELLDLCENYREQNDELHAYVMAQNTANTQLNQQRLQARNETAQLAQILHHVLTTRRVPVIPAAHIRLLERYRSRPSSL